VFGFVSGLKKFQLVTKIVFMIFIKAGSFRIHTRG
jgi:hypothetical protein